MDVPDVRSVMTPAPRAVDSMEDSLTALALMEQYGVRHLPVIEKGDLVGIVSERDLRGVRAALSGAKGEIGPPVRALCSRGPFVASPNDALDVVATEMANRRLGAALVTEGEKLVGIVTTVDLCRVLASLVGRLRADAASKT